MDLQTERMWTRQNDLDAGMRIEGIRVILEQDNISWNDRIMRADPGYTGCCWLQIEQDVSNGIDMMVFMSSSR